MSLVQVNDIYLRTSMVLGEKPAPSEIQLGEVMFNLSADQLMFVGTGGGAYIEVPLSGAVGGGGGGGGKLSASAMAPATATLGDLWVDTSNPAAPALNIYASGGWVAMAQVDGTTIQPAPGTGVLGVGTVDMGVIP